MTNCETKCVTLAWEPGYMKKLNRGSLSELTADGWRVVAAHNDGAAGLLHLVVEQTDTEGWELNQGGHLVPGTGAAGLEAAHQYLNQPWFEESRLGAVASGDLVDGYTLIFISSRAEGRPHIREGHRRA